MLEGNIPPLLSVGFLEFLQANIDLERDEIDFRKVGLKLPMKKLPSGHRTFPLVQWNGEKFPVPSDVQKKYGLSGNAFNLDGNSPSDCTKGAAEEFSMVTRVSTSQDEPNVHEHDPRVEDNGQDNFHFFLQHLPHVRFRKLRILNSLQLEAALKQLDV